MMGLMDMVALGIDKNFTNKALLMLLNIMMRWCVPLGHKGLVMSPYGPIVLGVFGREGCFSCRESGHKMKDCTKT